VGIEAARHVIPKVSEALSGLVTTMGKEAMYGGGTTIPYWSRVAQQTKLMPKGLASFLDSPAVQLASASAAGGATGVATGAAMGALSSPTDPTGGAVQGATQGGLLGMAGGGFGQWQKFQNPNQYIIAARGDWRRYRDMLPMGERSQFDKLSPTNQIILAQHAQHFPGLKTEYVNDPSGPRGLHYVDEAGRSTIQINLAKPGSVIAATMAHELTHAATTSGILPDIYDTLFGNPERGLVGQYTQLGTDGKPVSISPVTGRYSTGPEFAALKDQYTSALRQSGIPAAHLTDLDIAREIYAEHGVDYMLSGGAIQDANSAFRPGLYSENALKTAQAKLGYTFDENGATKGFPGNVTGSNVFQNLVRNPELAKLNETYFRTRWKNQQINPEDTPTRRFTKQDMQNPNTAEAYLRNASEILRKPDGTVMRDPNTGLPLYRTANEANRYNAETANQLHQALSALTDGQKADIGFRQEGNTIFARTLPTQVIDSLNRINQYNPHQAAALSQMSHILGDPASPGAEMRFFYHKALSERGKYGQFEGTEKLTVPYGIQVTKDKNVTIKAVDFNQLTNNYLRARGRDPYKSLWKSPDEFAQDAHTYFVNHSKNQPGAEGIGTDKRDAINALANFGTDLQKDSNPLMGSLPAGVRSIIKDYRIDRSSGWSATGSMRPFINEEQYRRMNMNYLPGAPGDVSYLPETAAVPGADPSANARPVTMRTMPSGKQKPVEIDYGLSQTPLVGDKAPPAKMEKGAENNFGHVDFLTKPEQQKLTHMDNASAVTDYADKLVDEYGKWKDDPRVMDAKGWYGTVLKYLKKGFGGDKQLFAELLSATSPQTGVVQNFDQALEAYRLFRAGKYDDAIREYKRTGKITDDMKPTKANGKLYGFNSDAVLKVLSGSWLDNVEGPKTPNFFKNLFQRGTDATIDMWAARTMHRLGNEGVEGAPDQWRIQPKSETGVSNLDFALSQQAFKQAADKLGMKPHELQAIMWYGEKVHYANKGYTKGGASAALASFIPQLKSYAAAPEFKPSAADTRRARGP
jgi:hypothetical protein